MSNVCVKPINMMLPGEECDMSKWAVVACDQYTSEPEYWKDVESIVGDEPSTLKLILPEVYLEEEDVEKRVELIEKNMKEYVSNNILHELPEGMMLVSRDTNQSCNRKGIVMAFDLEDYDYKLGSTSLIRPTEKTVEERIPPRLAVRKNASIELPHIMILIDDPDRTVIEPIYEKRSELEKKYDIELMKKGGRLEGWFIPKGEKTESIIQAIEKVVAKDVFNKRYNLDRDYPILSFAVGDGNHSMATAKAYWEMIKAGLTEEEMEEHPARYILAELVNIHDESLEIEAIYRVLFGVDCQDVLNEAKAYFEKNAKNVKFMDEESSDSDCIEIPWYSEASSGVIRLEDAKWSMPVAALQNFLDDYLERHGEVKIDYIHGLDTMKQMAKKKGNMGFYLPDPEKSQLFSGVIKDGVLPRKTFSMGEAREKRYYMEAKNIVK